MNNNITEEIENLAQIVWDYHHVNHVLSPSDIIFVLGSHDLRVAERAAELFLEGYAPYIVFSGGLGRLTEGQWNMPEADKFADIAVKKGVPKEKVLIENKSTNTGENVEFTRKVLEAHGMNIRRVIAVQKPYMERRTYATIMKKWPGIELVVTSPQISFDEYPNKEISRDEVINIMIGDLQRIKDYPAKGFQIEQEIPDNVWAAYQRLVELGFNRQLIK